MGKEQDARFGAGQQPDTTVFRTEACAEFAQFFFALQRETNEVVPPKRAFSPAAARAFLPHLSVIEIKEPKLALVRLVGTAIVNRTHIDNTRENFLDLIPESGRATSWRHLRRLIDTPCGCTLISREDYGHSSVIVEVVSFPLAGKNGPEFILSLSVEADRNKAPSRGDYTMQIGELGGYRYIDIGCGVGAA